MRLLLPWQVSWDTFDASEISICLALLSLFTAQSLLGNKQLLDDDEKKDDMRCAIRNHFVLGFLSLFVFSWIVIFNTLAINMHLSQFETGQRVTQMFAFITSPFLVIFCARTQETYRLTVGLI